MKGGLQPPKPPLDPPLPYALRKQIEEELDKLLQINCVESANSPYISLIVLVKKKEGTP